MSGQKPPVSQAGVVDKDVRDCAGRSLGVPAAAG